MIRASHGIQTIKMGFNHVFIVCDFSVSGKYHLLKSEDKLMSKTT